MFRNVRNKKFTDVISNKILTVNEQIENIAVLDNGQRIDVNRLLNPMYFDEYIDPNSFFNTNTFNIFAEKIKSIPNEVLEKLPENDSSIISNYDIEEEKRLLAEKYNVQQNTQQSQLKAQKQLDMLKSIVGEEEYSNDELTKMISPNQQPQPQQSIIYNQPQDENVIRINVEDSEDIKQEMAVSLPEKNKREFRQESFQDEKPSFKVKEDPITTIFKNVKKNTDFYFSLDIYEKIPRLDFLEMMEDSYEVSIIDYLAEEFTKKLLNEPSILKDKIAKEIRLLIENKDKVKKIPKVEEKIEDILPKATKPPIKKSTAKRKILKVEEKNNLI